MIHSNTVIFHFHIAADPAASNVQGRRVRPWLSAIRTTSPLNFSDYADALACLLVAEYVLKEAP